MNFFHGNQLFCKVTVTLQKLNATMSFFGNAAVLWISSNRHPQSGKSFIE